jgi:hypothetical protein
MEPLRNRVDAYVLEARRLSSTVEARRPAGRPFGSLSALSRDSGGDESPESSSSGGGDGSHTNTLSILKIGFLISLGFPKEGDDPIEALSGEAD